MVYKLLAAMVTQILLVNFGCVETNPGPDTSNICFGVWNLDSLLARDKHKINIIEGLNTFHRFDLFGVVESYLSPNITDDQLGIHGFAPAPFRADSKDPAGRLRGGVCLYYNENLPIINREDLVNIDETIVTEIKMKNKKVFFILSYRSPSYNSTAEVDDYCNKLQVLIDRINKEKPSMVVLTGDFNARSPLFWDQEADETLPGRKLSELMLLNRMDQIIDEPTHFPRDNIETCIDLVLTDQPNFVVHSGVIQSPDPRCKHQIINGKINFTIPCPPPYKRKLWSFNRANIDGIRANMRAINWDEYLSDKSVDDMVLHFTKTFLDIMSCNIPNRVVTIDDRDAPWITPEVKQAIKKNHRVFNKWKSKGKPDIGKNIVKAVNQDTNSKIEQAKKNYANDLESKLCDPRTSSNIFWSVVNRLVSNKKTTNIPPILENGTFITSFGEKAGLFNEYFDTQCQPLANGSTLPVSRPHTLKRHR